MMKPEQTLPFPILLWRAITFPIVWVVSTMIVLIWRIAERMGLMTLNDIIADVKSFNKSTGHSVYADKKRKQTHDVAMLARKQLKPIKKFPVDFSFSWHCNNRCKDKDGIAAGGRKVILDSLVSAGFMSNDGWKHIGDFKDTFVVDKDYVGVQVVLKY